jgi:hypothetical protein
MSRISAWINVIIGALIMVATLPGRTQGLGLITEPLLRDLNLDRVSYAHLNLWATLLCSHSLSFRQLCAARQMMLIWRTLCQDRLTTRF